MNNRMEELIKNFAESFLQKANIDMREFEPFLCETEKFVELLVLECANVVDADGDSYPHDSFGSKLKQHFGVEE